MNLRRARLAIEGGTPVRSTPLPYGRHTIDETDIAAVVNVLKSDWLTTGPTVEALERELCQATGARHAVAVSSGTAALHAMLASLNLTECDEVIVPALTFVATANAVLYCGARPVFADVDMSTLLIDPAATQRVLTPKTRAIVAVDYAGQPADYDALRAALGNREVAVLADACHALGGSANGRPVGSLADMSTFSFHPVKHVAAGEGGAIVCDNDVAQRVMRTFRNHGITTDHSTRVASGTWLYEMQLLGFNYRMPDINCALAISQLRKLAQNVARRREIAAHYDRVFTELPSIEPLKLRPGASHAYHLYVIKIDPARSMTNRSGFYHALRAENIGVNVHYIPVPQHPYFRRLGHATGSWPNAEAAYERILSLPIWPGMTDDDVESVVTAVFKVASAYAR